MASQQPVPRAKRKTQLGLGAHRMSYFLSASLDLPTTPKKKVIPLRKSNSFSAPEEDDPYGALPSVNSDDLKLMRSKKESTPQFPENDYGALPVVTDNGYGTLPVLSDKGVVLAPAGKSPNVTHRKTIGTVQATPQTGVRPKTTAIPTPIAFPTAKGHSPTQHDSDDYNTAPIEESPYGGLPFVNAKKSKTPPSPRKMTVGPPKPVKIVLSTPKNALRIIDDDDPYGALPIVGSPEENPYGALPVTAAKKH